MTFLNESGKSGVAKEGLGGRAEGALRGVRARRDADDAGQNIEPNNIIPFIYSRFCHQTRSIERGCIGSKHFGCGG